MKILITKQKNEEREIYFPEAAIERLRKIGEVRLNDKSLPLTQEELESSIKDIDVCITHWTSPLFTYDVLKNANRLKLIAHAAGSVANVVTNDVYNSGIKVCSANQLMAKYVAEGVFSYILAGLRLIPEQSSDMKNGVQWNRRITEIKTLYNAKIGFIGLGTVGMYLLDLLKPFDVKIKLFDPYLSKKLLREYGNVEMCSMEEVLMWGNIISIHASLTKETRHMINEERLRLIKDDALFVNTSRGAIVDESALILELEKKRFRAVLDVFENEPLDLDSPLRNMDNVIIMPHTAGAAAREQMTYTIIEEIERFTKGIPLLHEISFERYKIMTKE